MPCHSLPKRGHRHKRETAVLDRFYLIIDSPEWLDRLCPEGLRLAQLRIKEPDETLPDLVSRTLRTARKYGCTLVINDHWQAAIDAGADWLHLGQEDLDTADIKAIRKAGLKLGLSTHTPEELDRALTFDPDYVALGPIFPARGKVVDYAPQGIARLSSWKARINVPLIAIGGIRIEHAESLFEAGADSICVITDVLADADPEARCRAWIAASR
ncbi:thiamine-phosphate diphosphorylase [Roseibium suaedae]|uniref:Thiamine-phosphate diphosphorylase n=1 Tax=Roseibium suaedae TaxID=735517 RepID=A0A1M7FNS5_9HYPH|nr:thiamine-phosphate diphosphorylase [Roseibium suaedae]